MKRLLINCYSYTHDWYPTEWFSGYKIFNIAENGSSVESISRTTIQWILENYLDKFRTA